jgi:3-oxoacyl-[acyl-carrier protein] reductase
MSYFSGKRRFAKMFSGKKVIVTGGSRGLGKEIAKQFLLNGADVCVCARDRESLDSAKHCLTEYTERDQRVHVFNADISKQDEAEAFVDFACTNLKGIDILVNNAGIHGAKNRIDDSDFDSEAWKSAVKVNLFGTMHVCRAAVPYLKKSRRGKIINLSGGGATSPMPGMSAYAVSKAALVRFTETIAIELAPYDIDVNAVAPGAMNTRLLDDVLDNARGRVTDDYYAKALKQKEEGGASLIKAAELCLYLASERSNGVTGKLISAVWDDWADLHNHPNELKSDLYTLRRVTSMTANK